MGEGGRSYAQIHYNPDNLDDVVVTEVQEEAEASEEKTEAGEEMNQEAFEREPKQGQDIFAEEQEETMPEPEFEPEIFVEEQVETGEPPAEPEILAEKPEVEEPIREEPTAEAPIREEPIEVLVKHQASALEHIFSTLRRLEKKFTDEILNGENRNSAVKIMYKEMNDYKSGIVEKALKNVLYDVIDLRETMLAQSKFLREKKGQDFISLEEFESYADDLGDILEKHDVSIYKGETGKENVAVRQKIIRKVETEDESLVRTVAESLSYGYEYGDKILYPERISVYIKKK